MRRIFGSSKPAQPAVSLDEATQRVDARVQTLDDKIRALDNELVDYRERIKRTRPGPAQNTLKQKALRVLKQKKMYEQQRDQLSGQAFNMEQANFATQSVKDTLTTVSAMKDANKVLRGQLKKISIDDVDAMQDDMADLLDLNNEIQESLGRSYNVGEYDEADLDAELDALGDELDAEAPSYLDTLAAPEVPRGEPHSMPAAQALNS